MDAAAAGTTSIAEEAARVWAELPVRVDWPAVESQCAWAASRARSLLVVPAVRALVYLSLAMTVMILVEKLFVCAVCLAVRALRLTPDRRYRWEPIAAAAAAGGDVESGGDGGAAAASKYPMVLVQIPMYNEREVSKTTRESEISRRAAARQPGNAA
jgi:beta-mannan synthase